MTELTPEQKAHLSRVVEDSEQPAPATPSTDSSLPPQTTRQQLLGGAAEMLTGTKETELAKQLGIGPGPAPAGARLKSGLWPEKAQQFESLLTNLESEYGPNTRLRWVPELQRLAFYDPKQGSWQLVDTPGLDWGDFADVAGESFGAAGAVGALTIPGVRRVLAGPATRSTGGVRGALKNAREIMAATIGSAAGGAARSEVAQSQDPQIMAPPWQTTKTAAEEAIASMLADAGIRIGGSALQGGYNAVRRRTIPGEYAEAGLELPNYGSPHVDSINETLNQAGRGVRLKPTSGEILNDPQLLSFQQQGAEASALRRQGAIQKRKAEQADAYEAYLGEIGSDVRGAPQLGVGPTEREAGQAVASVTGEAAARKEAAVGARVGEAEKELAGTIAPVQSAAAQSPEAFYLGPKLRDVADREQEDFRIWAKGAYDSIKKQATDLNLEVPPENLSRVARDSLALFRQDIAGGKLRAEDASLAEAILGDIEVMLPGSQSGTLVAQPYEQIHRLVSNLKELKRRADNGLVGGVDKKFISDLTTAAVADRNSAIMKQGGPDLMKELMATEEEYRLRKTALNDTVVGDLLKRKGLIHNIDNEKVFGRVFYKDGVTDARIFGEILRDPRYVAERNQFNGAIARKYLNDVAPNGTVDPRKHEDWLRSYGSVLDQYLEPAEREMFDKIGGAGRYLLDLKTREEKFLKALNATFTGKTRKSTPGDLVKSIDPEDIVDHIWSKSSNIDAAAKVLQSEPPVWQGVRQVLLRRTEDAITEYSPMLERQVLSFKKLQNYLDKDDGINKQKMKSIFGTEYVADLETLLGALEVTSRTAKAANPSRSAVPFMPVLNFIVEGYRGAMGPLSHEAFLARRIMRAKTAMEAANLTDMVLDPDQLHKVALSVSSSALGRRGQISAAEAGRTALGADDDLSRQVRGLEENQYPHTPSVLRLRQILNDNPTLQDKIRAAAGRGVKQYKEAVQ